MSSGGKRHMDQCKPLYGSFFQPFHIPFGAWYGQLVNTLAMTCFELDNALVVLLAHTVFSSFCLLHPSIFPVWYLFHVNFWVFSSPLKSVGKMDVAFDWPDDGGRDLAWFISHGVWCMQYILHSSDSVGARIHFCTGFKHGWSLYLAFLRIANLCNYFSDRFLTHLFIRLLPKIIKPLYSDVKVFHTSWKKRRNWEQIQAWCGSVGRLVGWLVARMGRGQSERGYPA